MAATAGWGCGPRPPARAVTARPVFAAGSVAMADAGGAHARVPGGLLDLRGWVVPRLDDTQDQSFWFFFLNSARANPRRELVSAASGSSSRRRRGNAQRARGRARGRAHEQWRGEWRGEHGDMVSWWYSKIRCSYSKCCPLLPGMPVLSCCISNGN